jgi:cytoskeletal protein RodZ
MNSPMILSSRIFETQNPHNHIRIPLESILIEHLSDKSELTENSLDSSSQGDCMFNSKYVKYGALSVMIGLFATMFGAIGSFQNHAFAQITPAPEKYGDNGDSDESSSDGPSSNADDGGSSNDSDSSESSSASDGSESQDTGSSEEEQVSAAEEGTSSDSSESNPLMEQIINKVNQDFAAVGMPSLEW